jgi:hypothetical protein
MDGLGTAIINRGVPVGKSKTVSASGVTDDGGPNSLAGFTIVKADNIEAAIAMAKTCSHLEIGTIEVGQSNGHEDVAGWPS